jgi:phage terminase large subunit-like protein
MVEGESGLLSIYPDKDRPTYEPSKRRITWANGAVATLFNATEPGQLRGPQFDLAWCDELAKWRYARETWDQLQFGLRLGDRPRQIVTTTPRPIEVIKEIIAGKEGRVHVTRGRTMDNEANLAGAFRRKITARYQGTRLGRQELDAEILGDLPGALWSLASLDTYRLTSPPEGLARVLVSVDPAITSTEESDEHGVIVAGMHGQEGIVLHDGSLQGTPLDWARRAISLHDSYGADGIVVEVNQGGDMVAQTLRSVRPNVNVIEVRASRGKHVRAEPVAALYEQGRIRHAGAFAELENQMVQMTTHGYEGNGSPDRVDALVWAMTELFPDMVDTVPDVSRFKIGRRSGGWMGA